MYTVLHKMWQFIFDNCFSDLNQFQQFLDGFNCERHVAVVATIMI